MLGRGIATPVHTPVTPLLFQEEKGLLKLAGHKLISRFSERDPSQGDRIENDRWRCPTSFSGLGEHVHRAMCSFATYKHINIHHMHTDIQKEKEKRGGNQAVRVNSPAILSLDTFKKLPCEPSHKLKCILSRLTW